MPTLQDLNSNLTPYGRGKLYRGDPPTFDTEKGEHCFTIWTLSDLINRYRIPMSEFEPFMLWLLEGKAIIICSGAKGFDEGETIAWQGGTKLLVRIAALAPTISRMVAELRSKEPRDETPTISIEFPVEVKADQKKIATAYLSQLSVKDREGKWRAIGSLMNETNLPTDTAAEVPTNLPARTVMPRPVKALLVSVDKTKEEQEKGIAARFAGANFLERIATSIPDPKMRAMMMAVVANEDAKLKVIARQYDPNDLMRLLEIDKDPSPADDMIDSTQKAYEGIVSFLGKNKGKEITFQDLINAAKQPPPQKEKENDLMFRMKDMIRGKIWAGEGISIGDFLKVVPNATPEQVRQAVNEIRDEMRSPLELKELRNRPLNNAPASLIDSGEITFDIHFDTLPDAISKFLPPVDMKGDIDTDPTIEEESRDDTKRTI